MFGLIAILAADNFYVEPVVDMTIVGARLEFIEVKLAREEVLVDILGWKKELIPVVLGPL